MWLLRTDGTELRQFNDSATVPGGYAILSHVWGKPEDEQTLQQVQKIIQQGKNSPDSTTGPVGGPRLSDKILQCCRTARQDGYMWVWIDTCCIDKTSSAETSEAINSMFVWYAHAEVCYAYLADVSQTTRSDRMSHWPSSSMQSFSEKKFKESQWHRRGWTLQELIAPARVVFMSKEWLRIGTKRDSQISIALNCVTGIDTQYLDHTASVFDASLATRMTWTSRRFTTRVEDEAYCLLGIFRISMPTIYGEGRHAFQRLQEEIIKQGADTSLFAWGPRYIPTGANGELETLLTNSGVGSTEIPSDDHKFLFAASPHDFASSDPYMSSTPQFQGPQVPIEFTPGLKSSCARRAYLPSQWPDQTNENDQEYRRRTYGPFGRIELPSFEATSHGMKFRVPIIEVNVFTIAVLLCEQSGQYLGLFLSPASNTEAQDPTRRMYYTGCRFGAGPLGSESLPSTYRLVELGDDLYNLRFGGVIVKAFWRDIYVHARPGSGLNRSNPSLEFWPSRLSWDPPAPFYIPAWLSRTIDSLGLRLHSDPSATSSNISNSDADSNFAASTSSVSARSQPDPPRPEVMKETWLGYVNLATGDGIRLHVGRCDRDERQSYWLWASSHGAPDQTSYDHSCEDDHIDNWKSPQREFGEDKYRIRLSFHPSLPIPPTPEHPRILYIELIGSVYVQLQADKKCTIPSPDVSLVKTSLR